MQSTLWTVLALASLALADALPTLTTITTTNTITSSTGSTAYPSMSAYPDYDGGVCVTCPNVAATLEKDAGCPGDHPTFYYLDRVCSCCPIAPGN